MATPNDSAEQARALQDPEVLRERLIECGRDRARLQERLARAQRHIDELKVQKLALQDELEAERNNASHYQSYAFDHWPD